MESEQITEPKKRCCVEGCISIKELTNVGRKGKIYCARHTAQIRKYDKRRKQKNKDLIRGYNKIVKPMIRIITLLFWLLVKLLIVVVLGMGSKNIIFLINKPLGEGYALVASYTVTALLWVLLPDFWRKKDVAEVQGK